MTAQRATHAFHLGPYRSLGRLYNWYAVNDERALCKRLYVPSDEDWIALEMTLGMSEVLANSSYYTGVLKKEGF